MSARLLEATYRTLIDRLEVDGNRTSHRGDLLGELTAEELAIAYAEHGLEADNAALDEIGDLRAWCTEQDPQTALAKLRSLKLLLDEHLSQQVRSDLYFRVAEESA